MQVIFGALNFATWQNLGGDNPSSPNSGGTCPKFPMIYAHVNGCRSWSNLLLSSAEYCYWASVQCSRRYRSRTAPPDGRSTLSYSPHDAHTPVGTPYDSARARSAPPSSSSSSYFIFQQNMKQLKIITILNTRICRRAAREARLPEILHKIRT